MQIRTMFSHADRLVTVVVEGDLFPAQITELLQLIDRHDARAYAKLVDIRRLRSCVEPDGAGAGTEERPIRIFHDEPSGWAWL